MRMRMQVLSSYRSLIRAVNTTFAGDTEALMEMRRQIRLEFSKRKTVPQEEVIKLLEEAHSVETYVRSIVQARINEKGNYELKLPKDLPSGTTLEPIVKD